MKPIKVFLMALSMFVLVLLLSPQTARTQSQQKPEELAQKSAEAWLALTDSGKYGESWEQAASFFKDKVSRDQWIGSMTAYRSPMGKVLSRTLKGASYRTSLPNAPAGEYVVIQYNTSFQNQKDAIETVTPMLDKDGKWRVSGYYMK
ncbi:MAG TPA: DUF4019 domain-containing protein [Candidatus Eremiobacteraceae bacterium]|nr:DUF4019 domain-containing protein [Candidatus Eremiobacteraceae bacterium]